MGLLRKVMHRRAANSPRNDHGHYKDSIPISENLEENFNSLSSYLNGSKELEIKKITLKEKALGLVYLNTLVDLFRIEQFEQVLKAKTSSEEKLSNFLPSTEIVRDHKKVMEYLLQGTLALFIEGEPGCHILPMKRSVYREPIQPDAQKSEKGPKDGFVEDLNANLFLLRNRLKDEQLRLRQFTVGTRSKSRICLLYIEDLAPPDIIKTITERLQSIDTDIIADNVDLAQFLEDSWLSPFPQMEYAERPDVVASALTNGRAAIFHDSSPGVMLAPTTFFDLIDVPDDYYNTWFISASIIRFIRLIAIIISAFLPSLFIALTAYNPDFIPTNLALLVAESREGVALPTPIEAFVIVSISEIGREAVLRLPTIPALITGIAALLVSILACTVFQLVSPAMVIVIFFSIICSSVIVDKDLRIAIRELQFFYMFMASLLGIFGVAITFFYLSAHAVTLKSFGIPFMSPMAPLIPRDWLRLLFKLPAFSLPRAATYHSQDPDSGKQTINRKEGTNREKSDR